MHNLLYQTSPTVQITSSSLDLVSSNGPTSHDYLPGLLSVTAFRDCFSGLISVTALLD